MFKNIETYSQKKLKTYNVLFNILYFLLTFVAPLTVIIVSFYQIGKINNQTTKTSIVFIIITICILFAVVKYFSKQISKMRILNIDGSYNHGVQTLKHALELVCKVIIPSAILIISIMFATTFKEFIEFYNQMIITSVSFFIGGLVIDRLFIAFIDDEMDLREKVAEQNAISRRMNIK